MKEIEAGRQASGNRRINLGNSFGSSQSSKNLQRPQRPGYQRKRTQLPIFCRRRQQQQKNQVDRLSVDCIELNRLGPPHQQAERSMQFRQSCMLNGYATTYSGRSEVFALEQQRYYLIDA